MRDIENRTVNDDLWNEPEDKSCRRCGYSKKLCECDNDRE